MNLNILFESFAHVLWGWAKRKPRICHKWKESGPKVQSTVMPDREMDYNEQSQHIARQAAAMYRDRTGIADFDTYPIREVTQQDFAMSRGKMPIPTRCKSKDCRGPLDRTLHCTTCGRDCNG